MSGLLPIRCFTCGKIIADKQIIYENMLKDGVNPEQIFKKIGITRYCCRRMFLGHVNLYDKLQHYEKTNDTMFYENK